MACTQMNSTKTGFHQLGETVVLELSIPNRMAISEFSNLPFSQEIELVELKENRMVLSVNTKNIELEDAIRQIEFRGLKINKQYIVEQKATTVSEYSSSNGANTIQIPEISFPNIFKALVVFY